MSRYMEIALFEYIEINMQYKSAFSRRKQNPAFLNNKTTKSAKMKSHINFYMQLPFGLCQA